MTDFGTDPLNNYSLVAFQLHVYTCNIDLKPSCKNCNQIADI